MNKFSFIKQLLENEKFNHSQKDRFLKLVAKELETTKGIDDQVLEDIELIKRKIGLEKYNKPKNRTNESLIDSLSMKVNDSGELSISNYIVELSNEGVNSEDNKESEVKEQTIQDTITYLNPKDLYNFLLEYNQDPILKYTCHTIDSAESLQNILDRSNAKEYDFLKHRKIIHSNFKKLSFNYKGKVLKNIIGLMSTYLGTYNKNGSWSNKIRIKWISKELELWCEQHSGKVPNPLDAFQTEKFRFQTIELKNGSSLSNFSDLVIYFKHLFHIKNTNPLKLLIEESIFFNFSNSENYKFSFDQVFSNNIDLFTYTEALIQAFNKIIEISKKYHADEILDVKLFFGYDEKNFKEFKIVILNSKIFGKNSSDFRLGDDLTDLINKQINGLCNFYIKAFFEDKKSTGLLNVWNGQQMVFEPCAEEIEGVEFILKMH